MCALCYKPNLKQFYSFKITHTTDFTKFVTERINAMVMYYACIINLA